MAEPGIPLTSSSNEATCFRGRSLWQNMGTFHLFVAYQ